MSRIRFADAQRLSDLPKGPALQVVQEHNFPLYFVEDAQSRKDCIAHTSDLGG
jgi:hypothetical protein